MIDWITASFKGYKRCLNELLTPKEIVETLDMIDFDRLYQRGYRFIFFDVDNTLLPPDKIRLSLQMENMVNGIKNKGFTVFFVSNNSSKARIHRAATQVNVPGYYFAIKPFPYTAYDISTEHQVDLSRTIVIGDQLLTDIIFSNWIKAYGIFVEPLNKKLSFIKTLQRNLELALINWLA